MSWLAFAFSGPVLWAISTHFDKYLVERYFKHSDVAVLLLFTAFMGVLTLPFIVFYEPTVFQLDPGSMALIALSGVLYMGATLFYLRALQSEEASVVAPFFQTVPLFGYVLGYFVLGETLSIVQMAGGALIIIGALIVSVRSGQNVRIFKLRLVLLMLACGLAAAVSGLIFKAFAIKVAFWTTTFWMFAGEAIFGAALLLVGSYRRQLAELLRVNAAALLTINGSNELINLGGGLGSRYALMFAPLSIVQAISSTTTLFVFAFGVALSVAFPRLARETTSFRDLVQKGAAAVLVALGVALVTR
jgi:drug/metabolite transporter (DMT)-like permease